MADQADKQETKVDLLSDVAQSQKKSEPLIHYDKDSQKVLKDLAASNTQGQDHLPDTEIFDLEELVSRRDTPTGNAHSDREIPPTVEEYLIDATLATPGGSANFPNLATAIVDAMNEESSENINTLYPTADAEFVQSRFGQDPATIDAPGAGASSPDQGQSDTENKKPKNK